MADRNFDSSSIGARCAYCRAPWTQNDAVKCPECDTISHRECWVENGGCPILSCAAAPRDEAAPAVSAGRWGHTTGAWPAASHSRPQQSWTAATASTRAAPSTLPAFSPQSAPQPPSNTPVDESTQRRREQPVGPARGPERGAPRVNTGGDGQGEPWWADATSTTGGGAGDASWDAGQAVVHQNPPTPHNYQPRGLPHGSIPERTSAVHAPSPGAQPRPAPALPAPGWYPDPYSQHHLRWWDGQSWSDHTHPR